MIHNDGTMDVDVGGTIERRSYRIECRREQFGLPSHLFGMPKYVPELRPGEMIAECIADLIPKIFKTRG